MRSRVDRETSRARVITFTGSFFEEIFDDFPVGFGRDLPLEREAVETVSDEFVVLGDFFGSLMLTCVDRREN